MRSQIEIAYQFEAFIERLFHKTGYETQREVDNIDLIARDAEHQFCIEIKSGFGGAMKTLAPINKAIARIVDVAKKKNMVPVLVCGCEIPEVTKQKYRDLYESLVIVDIKNLLDVVQYQETEKNELLSLLSYSTEEIEPEECPIPLGWMQLGNPFETLLEEFNSCIAGRDTFTKYEQLCTKLLNYTFSDDLSLWKEQIISNQGLYRFDLLCRIKNGNTKTFWSIMEEYFHSKYIIFEFKNYTDPITQKEIYTTEKYLYSKALRSVAIIIAKNGSSDNAVWAAKGCLRESGKLILLLDNNDLKTMAIAKSKQDDPSEYLLGRLDTLLSELEK